MIRLRCLKLLWRKRSLSKSRNGRKNIRKRQPNLPKKSTNSLTNKATPSSTFTPTTVKTKSSINDHPPPKNSNSKNNVNIQYICKSDLVKKSWILENMMSIDKMTKIIILFRKCELLKGINNLIYIEKMLRDMLKDTKD